MEQLTIEGRSGKQYVFGIYPIGTNFKATRAIYILIQIHQAVNNITYYDFIYCGKTDDLSSCFDNAPTTKCVKNNEVNFVCVKEVSAENERAEMETDILKGNNFKFNKVLV